MDSEPPLAAALAHAPGSSVSPSFPDPRCIDSSHDASEFVSEHVST